MSRILRVLLAANLFALAPTASFTSLHAQTSNLSASYQQGLEAEQNEELDVALDRFQTALKQSPNSPVCYEAIARVQSEMGNDKAAIATTAQMISAAPDVPAKAHAEMLQANIYYQQFSAYTIGGGAYEKNPKHAQQSLEKAEAALERASAEDPSNEPLRMLHAHVLADLHHDEDASREFQACAAIPGTSPTECARALKLSHNAELARFEPAPSFKATTLDGQPVSLDSLTGKVVLIDFWGSWCHFCVSDSDYVQSMLDSFDPKSFVLLEINEGDSREDWLNYVNTHRLHGVQVQDTDRQLQSLFHVSGFPTYILIDADGLVRMRVSGAVGDLRGGIRNVLTNQPPTPLTGN
ncbi:MAG: redoxin domain-containing protein [Acidobacteriaceae bacterium]